MFTIRTIIYANDSNCQFLWNERYDAMNQRGVYRYDFCIESVHCVRNNDLLEISIVRVNARLTCLRYIYKYIDVNIRLIFLRENNFECNCHG